MKKVTPRDAKNVTLSVASETFYDVVVVGSGISGSIIASVVGGGDQKYKVLIIEAGSQDALDIKGYESHIETFYTAMSKDNNAPYQRNPNAPMPRSNDVKPRVNGVPDTSTYLVQEGKFISDFTYSKIVGGTTMHFESKTPRMLPEDFKMKTHYGHGLDWPISYKDIMPYYIKAEREIGVSGEVESQNFSKEKAYDDDYVFPMHEMPPSYLDQVVGKDLNGMDVNIDKENFTIQVTTFPQGRNGIPNVKYKKFNNGEIFRPLGAVGLNQVETGGRCQGNTNCTPICPVQAKYDARKTLAKALVKDNVDFISQTVASKVITDPVTGLVTALEVKRYQSPDSTTYETAVIKGKIFVLAANAIENARLMLASGLPGSSDMVGRNLMDHPYLLAWGLLPEAAGTTRGTICTSGISNLRNGDFRKKQAAFAIDIHNDGWGWATGSPYTDLINIVDNKNKFGKELRKELIHQLSKQLLLAIMVEMEPDRDNRVTVDPNYTDRLGNCRPVITLKITDYALEGVAFARQLSKRIFQRLGAEDCTAYSELDYGYVAYKGQGYAIRGGNHICGTHIMGENAKNSVVNARQRSWDHKNLYLVGGGSLPTIGTSNTTLTIAALGFMSAESVLADLAAM